MAYAWTGLRLVIPEEGNRYLVIGDFWPLLNEKGVVLSQGFRGARDFPPYPGTPEYISDVELLRICDSAAEYVKLWSKNMTEYGSSRGAECTLVVDPKEGYCLEGSNLVYSDPANHAIHGPMTDQVFVSANFFISERLKRLAEAGIGLGYTRAKRLWEMLIDRQYDSITQQPSEFSGGSGITLAYLMSCLRDHGNISPEEGKMSSFVPEERGQGALCNHGETDYTSNAFFGVSRADYTDLFSCEWFAFGQPCISPFLPIYIGIKKLPKAMTTRELFDLFDKLRLAVEWHPEYRAEITQYWTIFEIQAIEQSHLLEHKVAQLVDEGDVEGGRKLLTEFVERKSIEAKKAGQNILQFLHDLPMLGATDEANPPWGS
jgi:hypothetical protein